MVLSSPASAFADCHHTSAAIGSSAFGLGLSTQEISWSSTSSADEVYMRVINDNITTPVCFNTWFDWATAALHYDIRLVRNCEPNAQRQAGLAGHMGLFTEPNTSRNLLGVQKAAACSSDGLFVKDMNTCLQSSSNYPGCNIPEVNVKAVPNFFTEDWMRGQFGQLYFDSGGDPTDDQN